MSFSAPKRGTRVAGTTAQPSPQASNGDHSLALAQFTVAIQKQLNLRPSEAVVTAKKLYSEVRNASGGSVPSEAAMADILHTEVYGRMAKLVATNKPRSSNNAVESFKPILLDEQPAQEVPPAPSPGKRGGRATPTEAEIEALMSIDPGKSFINSLPPTTSAYRHRAAHAAAGAARRNSASGSGSGPGLDVWGELDIVRGELTKREEQARKDAAAAEKHTYNATLAAQVEERRRIRADESAKEAAYKASIRQAAQQHEVDMKEAEERKAAHAEVEANKFQAFNAAVQKLKSREAEKERRYELAYVTRLKAEEEAITNAQTEKRAAALSELRTFLAENDEYIRNKHEKAKQARREESEAVKKAQAEALQKELDREADVQRRLEDIRKRMDKMSEVYRKEEEKDTKSREKADKEHADYIAATLAAEKDRQIKAKAELEELRRQLDEQKAVKEAIKREEQAEEHRLAEWMRADNAAMKAELAAKKARNDAEVVTYRTNLEGQIGEAFTRSAQPDETPFERARNQRLIAEIRDMAAPGGSRKGRRGSGTGPI